MLKGSYMRYNFSLLFFIFWLICCESCSLFTQQQTNNKTKNDPLEIIKPPNFQTMELPIEKSSRKDFTFLRRVYNNITIHYNYISNIRQELDSIIEKAQNNFHEDYLLTPIPFYNYSHDFITQNYSAQLDSILFRLTSALLLHDARNRWVDEIYLLMGKTYFYKQNYDSAFLMFEFIKYKFDKSMQSQTTKKNKQFTLSSIINKETATWYNPKTEARNDALVWLVQVYIMREEYDEALVLINALDKDIFFPKRLIPFYEEVKAYYYFKKQQYIETAQHLVSSITLSHDRQERARKSFLAGQLYNLAEKEVLATKFMRESINLTYDPVLEIFARMNFVLQEQHPNVHVINDHIKNLLKLLRRERFKRYKDLVYYAASFMALKKSDIDEAIGYIEKSVSYTTLEYGPDKERIYAQLFDLLLKKKKYYPAAKALDSVSENYLTTKENMKDYSHLRDPLHKYVKLIDAKKIQDSLEQIASLSEEKREEYVKKEIDKQYREVEKQIKLKRQLAVYYNNDNSIKDNWGFTNKIDVENGIKQFKNIWGNRKNTDNWRRKNDIGFIENTIQETNNDNDSIKNQTYKEFATKLLQSIPITQEQKEETNIKMIKYLYQLGEIYYLDLKDYDAAQKIFTEILNKYPNSTTEQEVFLNLYFSLQFTDNIKEIEILKKRYVNKYPDGKYLRLFTTDNILVEGKNENDTYEYLFTLYQNNDLNQLLPSYLNFVHTYPNSKLKIKVKLLLATTEIKNNDETTGEILLNEIIKEADKNKNDNTEYYTEILNYANEVLTNLKNKKNINTN